MSPRVVVTGLGTTNPLGGNVADTWRRALAGESGVRTLEHDWVEKYELPVTFAGQIVVSPKDVLETRQIRRTDPSTQFALVSAREAWADSGLDGVDGERLGVVVSSGIGGIWTIMDAWDTIRDRGARRVLPMTIPMLMPNAPAANISVEYGAKAGAHAPVSACASGAEAIAMGIEMIRNGRADVVLAGGTEAPLHAMPIASFAKMQALSTRNDDPAGASRPFDVTRDGFVMGEGAGVIVLESLEHAQARGARIYAELAGIGMSADAYDVAPPDPSGQGQERAMRFAVEDAGVDPHSVVHVNAHGTSTPAGDLVEAQAIARVCGGNTIVTATKSMTGHLLGGAGALETIFTILAVKERKVPPTINLTQPEPELPVDVVTGAPRSLPDGDLVAINNAFGFGGHNVALVVKSF